MRPSSLAKIAVGLFAVVLFGATLAATAQAPAAATGGKGPDILGLRIGMAPQEAYTLLQSIDSTHRVTVGQVLIPPILGNQPAVYGMAPETLGANNSSEFIAVSFSLPPNPQQAFLIHRQLNQTIHTTVDQIIASLRQKYGQESAPPVGPPNNPNFVWLYNEQGQLASPSVAATTMHDCGNTGLTFVSTGNMPPTGMPPPPGVLPQANAIVSPFPLPTIPDPSKNPQCQGWVLVRAIVTGKVENGNYNDSLDITISAYGIQKRAAYALGNALNGVANKQQQQDLNKARQQSVPTL
jgi:hypothetical protein